MKTVRDVFHENGLNYSQIVGEDSTVVSIGLGGFNQALKELEEALTEALVYSKLAHKSEQCPQCGSHFVVETDSEETRKAIKSIIGGK